MFCANFFCLSSPGFAKTHSKVYQPSPKQHSVQIFNKCQQTPPHQFGNERVTEAEASSLQFTIIYFQFIIAAFVTKFTRTLTKVRERRWISGVNTMSMSKTQKVRNTFGIRMVGRMRWDFQLLSMPEIYQWVSSCDFRFLQINIEYKEHPVSQLCNTGAV